MSVPYPLRLFKISWNAKASFEQSNSNHLYQLLYNLLEFPQNYLYCFYIIKCIIHSHTYSQLPNYRVALLLRQIPVNPFLILSDERMQLL